MAVRSKIVQVDTKNLPTTITSSMVGASVVRSCPSSLLSTGVGWWELESPSEWGSKRGRRSFYMDQEEGGEIDNDRSSDGGPTRFRTYGSMRDIRRSTRKRGKKGEGGKANSMVVLAFLGDAVNGGTAPSAPACHP